MLILSDAGENGRVSFDSAQEKKKSLAPARLNEVSQAGARDRQESREPGRGQNDRFRTPAESAVAAVPPGNTETVFPLLAGCTVTV